MSDEVKAEPLDDAEPITSAADAPEAARRREVGPALSPEHVALLRKAIPAVWFVAAIATGVIWGIELAVLVLAAGVLALAITLMWSSVQSLTGSSSLGFEEALGLGAPSKVEEEKRSVLRALKDLEYERSVGKITPEDYAELVAKYRVDAKRLMQSVDEKLGPARAQVEQQIAERLGRAGLAPSKSAAPADAPPSPDAAPADAPPSPDAAPAPPEEKP